MLKQQRIKLHFGPYQSPRFRYDAVVTDLIRGDVRIKRLSDSRIAWPLAAKRGQIPQPWVNATLARAIRQETTIALKYWFGVSTFRVWVWPELLKWVGGVFDP